MTTHHKSSPILHPRTKTLLDSFLNNPSHGLLLAGKEGSGKLFTALWLSSELGTQALVIEPEEGKNTISIEQIRELYRLTRTANNVTVIIKEAHTLAREAQNAFLKLLEEPPQNTWFILTAISPESLLPTIRSRSQVVEILPPEKKALLSSSKDHSLSEPQVTSLLHTSEGLAGSYFTLLAQDEAYTAHTLTVVAAKEFYSSTPYERHILCVENKFEKEWISGLLQLLATIVESLLSRVNEPATQSKLLKQANLIEVTAQNILNINGNPKIHLARLCQEL